MVKDYKRPRNLHMYEDMEEDDAIHICMFGGNISFSGKEATLGFLLQRITKTSTQREYRNLEY